MVEGKVHNFPENSLFFRYFQKLKNTKLHK